MHKIVKGENKIPLINQIEHIKILLHWFHIQFWANIKFHDIQFYLILLQSIEYNGKC